MKNEKPQDRTGLAAMVVGLLLLVMAPVVFAAGTFDLPACEAGAGNGSSALSLGLVQPYAAPEVVEYAVNLARRGEAVSVCSESWSEVLPRSLPWARHLERGYGFALFGLALLVVAAVLTALVPRRKWRRTTLVGVLAVGALSWLGGVAALAAFHALSGQRLVYGTVVSLRQPLQPVVEWLDVAGARELEAALSQRKLVVALPVPVPVVALGAPTTVMPNGEYRVFHRLNLRERPGVEAPRFAVLPVGEIVRFDGANQGDWWRVQSKTGQTGWASSIWLRRLDEAVPPGP